MQLCSHVKLKQRQVCIVSTAFACLHSIEDYLNTSVIFEKRVRTILSAFLVYQPKKCTKLYYCQATYVHK